MDRVKSRVTSRVTWCGQVLAESDQTVERGGARLFPPAALRHEFLKPSHRREIRGKSVASYLHVAVDGNVIRDGAWRYEKTAPGDEHLEGYVAFRTDTELDA